MVLSIDQYKQTFVLPIHEQEISNEYGTIWPLYYFSFTKFLEQSKIFLHENEKENKVKLSEINSNMRFLCNIKENGK